MSPADRFPVGAGDVARHSAGVVMCANCNRAQPIGGGGSNVFCSTFEQIKPARVGILCTGWREIQQEAA